jgi:hypothetical protein
MNTNGLAKHYGILTPWERLPLILAASDRGDVAEVVRLARAAPRKGWELPDYHGLGQGLRVLQLLYLQDKLETALLLFSAAVAGADKTAGPRWEWAGDRMRLLGYRMTVLAEGWRRFCAGLHLDPEARLRPTPPQGLGLYSAVALPW